MLRCLVFAIFLIHTSAFAQQRVISGRITDSTTNSGISGASIHTEKHRIFVSGKSGIFYLHLDSSESSFTVVYPGYTSKKVVLTKSSYYTVQLSAHADVFAGKLSVNKLRIGYFDLEPRKMIRRNNYEGLRLGVVLSTNEKLSRYYSLNAAYAYGFKDKGHKYAAGITLRVMQDDSFNIKLNYLHDVNEPGEIIFRQYKVLNTEPYRQANLSIMDKLTSMSAAVSFKAIKYLETELFLSLIERIATSPYRFGDQDQRVFHAAEPGVAFRYVYREGQAKHPAHPEVYLEIKKGLKQMIPADIGGDFEYMRYDLRLSYNIPLGGLGVSRLQLRAGKITGDLPVSFLYNMRANFGNKISFYSINSFETMRMSEFFSDRYMCVNYVHNLGKLFMKKKKASPEFSLITNAAVGDIANTASHKNINFKRLNKGYYESGAVFVIDIKGLAAIFGLGGFYRYGPYSLPTLRENLAGKIYIVIRLS